MNNDFKENLKRYQNGLLSESEAAIVEEEIVKYRSLKDYLDELDDNEDEFFRKLRNEMDHTVSADRLIGKKINRKMVKKIITLILATVLACVIVIPMLYLSVSSFLGKAFRLNGNEFAHQRNFTEQFMHMAFPQVNNIGSSDHTEFYNQQFSCFYKKGIGHKELKHEIEVNYRFGSLTKPNRTTDEEERMQFYNSDSFHAINNGKYTNFVEWEILRNAPKGTRAQIFIAFQTRLNPQQAFRILGKKYFDTQKNFDISLLADVDSKIVIGNGNPAYYYGQNRKSSAKQDELGFIKKFNACDNATQKQVLLFGLNQIKVQKKIVDYIAANYTSDVEAPFGNINQSITYVQKNGVQYVGAIITGDTKELLELENNSSIVSCSVEDIVVW